MTFHSEMPDMMCPLTRESLIMRMLALILFLSSFIFHPSSVAFAQMPYDAGDWTSFKDFRHARSLDAGTRDLFVATSGGLLHYQLFRQMWYDPVVVGYGLSAPVELDDPTLLLLDEDTGYLWVATKTQLLQYDYGADRWHVVERHLWTEGDRVVNIGVGGNDLWVETVPAHLYSNFFQYGSPLPLETWLDFVTRYKGSRVSGGFQMELNPPPTDQVIRWRGLRSKLPFSRTDLMGGIGLPPVNFPSLIMPPGWVWQPDGTLLDDYLRPMAVTDWLVDRFGVIWTTFWGAGVMRGDLRLGKAEFYSAGPAGDDVRAVLVEKNDYWIAGLDEGDRRGISHASPDLRTWQCYEKRDDSRISSTAVWDIADWDGLMWFATEQGLLSFNMRDKVWKTFAVFENLQADQVRALAQTDSELWIGNSQGLCRMNRTSHEIRRVPSTGIELAGVSDMSLCSDTLYVGTPQGLFCGSIKTRQFVFKPLDPGLLNSPVRQISTIGSQVWLATGDGVMVYDQSNGQSKSWTAQAWLGNSELQSIYAGAKFTWVGTEKNGFYRYNRISGEWISYTKADGLVDNSVQVMREDGDDLLIGTMQGLTRFYWNRSDRAR
jgi:hypothetical protein